MFGLLVRSVEHAVCCGTRKKPANLEDRMTQKHGFVVFILQNVMTIIILVTVFHTHSGQMQALSQLSTQVCLRMVFQALQGPCRTQTLSGPVVMRRHSPQRPSGEQQILVLHIEALPALTISPGIIAPEIANQSGPPCSQQQRTHMTQEVGHFMELFCPENTPEGHRFSSVTM